jgi:nitrous-oxide reductase
MKRKIAVLIFAVVGALAIVALQRYSAAERGERRFAELGCSGCHFSGGGPNLTQVVHKHDDALLERFILDPQSVYRERNMKTLNNGYMFMPRVVASREDVRDIIAYFHSLEKQTATK